MNNTKINNQSKEDYLRKQILEIKKLIRKRKTKLAKKIIIELFEYFPENKELLSQLFRCYLKEKKYKEIIELLALFDENDVFLKITVAAIKLNMEEKLAYLYDKYYYDYCLIGEYDEIYGHSYRILRYFLMKKFETNYKINTENLTYKENQNWNYDEANAINFIKVNYEFDNIIRYEKFNKEINIEELFFVLKSNIEHNYGKEFCDKFGDHYLFHYPNCGRTQDGKICNHIKVSTIFNTSNIYNMHPVIIDKNHINEDVLEIKSYTLDLDTPKPRTRIKINRIEKFNNKYSR